MTLTQTVYIPADRRLRLDLEIPSEVPEGQTDVVIQFPVLEKVQPEATVKPKTADKKIGMTRKELEEMVKNSPTLHKIAGILHTDMTLDEIRMARLAKHL